MGSGTEALSALERLKPRFHPNPENVDGALENQFTAGPREIEGAGSASYAIGSPVLRYLADLPAATWTSVESGCGYSTVVLANAFGTHICVNPDLASNRLVGEFVDTHFGATGLRFVEQSSDQGLPALAADNTRVQLALIDGNHSHPFPLLDFHYMDLMLAVDGRLLVDNTEIDAVHELMDFLDVEPAYEFERLIGNCAAYRKVKERTLGWKSQTLRRISPETEAARRELAQLRKEVTPELRAVLRGETPLPMVDAAMRDDVRSTRSRPSTRPGVSTIARTRMPLRRRHIRQLVRWYTTPSGALAGAGLVLLGVGLVAPGLWRLAGLAGIALLALFLPYRFVRQQRRNDLRLEATRVDVINRVHGALDSARGEMNRYTDELSALSGSADSLRESIEPLQDTIRDLSERVATIEAGLTARRYAASKALPSARLELTLSDETASLETSLRTNAD